MATTTRDRELYAERNPERTQPPVRRAFPSREIEIRARQARSETLGKMIGWLAWQPVVVAKRWILDYRDWRTRRDAVRELQSLDNRMLRDLGVGRSEIEWRVAGGDESRAVEPAAVTGAKVRIAAGAKINRLCEAEKRAA